MVGLRMAAGILMIGLSLGLRPQSLHAEPAKIGLVFNTTGSQAVLDVQARHGAMLAVDGVNQKHGPDALHLAPIAIEGDSMPETVKARIAAALDRQPGIAAFLGLSDSDMVLAAARAAAQKDKVFLTSGATSPKLPAQVPVYLFLACFGDNVQAAAAAEWLFNKRRVQQAAVLFDPNNIYTRLLHEYFAESFQQLGGTVQKIQAIEPRAEQLALPAIADTEAVFLSVETAEDASRVARQLRKQGYTGLILGGDGYDAATVWAKNTGLNDIFFTTHVYIGKDNTKAIVREFLEAYERAYSGESPSAFAALGYDAVGLMAEALRRRDAGAAPTLEAALASIEGYVGVTGSISYTNESRVPRKSVSILSVSAGEQHFVEEVLPQSVPKP